MPDLMTSKVTDHRGQSPSPHFTYNRADVLIENIRAYINLCKAASLLDIGAGAPMTATPLSRSVNRYLAIEEDKDMVVALRSAGLNVVCGTFPLPIRETFDLVLSCHSVPETDICLYPEFLDSAW